MYVPDEHDSVVEMAGVPACDPGAPLPALIAGEHSARLLYVVSEPDPSWDGSSVTVADPGSEHELIAVVEFEGALALSFGPPNDEAFSGHPLAARGLHPYAAFEIRESSWIRGLERMNSVHPRHTRESFESYRHFIFAFHDSTFECVANGYTFSTRRDSIRSLARALSGSLS